MDKAVWSATTYLMHRAAIVVTAITVFACDSSAQPCSEPSYVRVVYDYDCVTQDDTVTLGAWGPRFLGVVVQGCTSGTLNLAIDEPGEWHVEAKTGAASTLECDVEITSEMIADGLVIDACES